MRVLRSLAETPPAQWTVAAVDDRIGELFFGPGGEGDTNLQFVRDMLTKKAFNREAVLEAYAAVRSGARVPDKELDQVASWLKLSGIVRRQAGLLRVRNAIYDRVFDQRWARVHRKLHVNWRRRLTRVAAALLILTVLVTIPLAIYALRQQAAAEAERDESARQRDEATRQLLGSQESLRTAQEAVAALKEFDPKAAAQLTSELTANRAAADQKLAQLTQEREQLLRARDEAQAQVQKLTQEIAALKPGQQRPAQAATAPPAIATVTVPDAIDQPLDEVALELRKAGFRLELDEIEDGSPRGNILRQFPAAGSVVARNSVIYLLTSLGPRAAAARSVVDDTQQVMRVLQRYQAAYQALDVKALTSIHPSADVKNLQAAFNDLEGLRYDLRVPVDGIKFTPDGQTASVTVFVTSLPTFKAGNTRKDAVTTTSLFTLRKASGIWTIQNVARN
jgi:hypothetical protein